MAGDAIPQNASLNMDLDPQFLLLLAADNNYPAVNVNLLHPDHSNSAPTINISYSYLHDLDFSMEPTVYDNQQVEPLQMAPNPAPVNPQLEVEVFYDEQGYEYRFINPDKHIHLRDVLLRCNTAMECSGMACMQDATIVNVGEHDHPPPQKEAYSDPANVEMVAEESIGSFKRVGKRKIATPPPIEINPIQANAIEMLPAPNISVNIVLNMETDDHDDPEDDPLASEEEEPRPKIPRMDISG